MSLLLLLLLSVTTFHKSLSSNDHKFVQCNEKDEETLLFFKKGINDSSHGKISTWLTEKDCCTWEGVHCDNVTGRVTELDLHDQNLAGEINLSILKLEFLSYLDLCENEFDVLNIPATLHNFTHPSSLFYLDLSSFAFLDSGSTLHMDNLDWLSPFSSLKYLNLSGIDLHKETNWLQAVNTLPSLLDLQLSDCNLNNFIINPSIEFSNLSSLVTLDLSRNNITSQLKNLFFNITKDLTYLNLLGNNIYGEIPPSLQNLQNFRHLDLSWNQLQGSIPYGIGQEYSVDYINPNRTIIDLSANNLSGEVPLELFQLVQLQTLNLSHNNFIGTIPKMIGGMKKMESLDLSNNKFCGEIPQSMSLLNFLSYLNLSYNNFDGKIPIGTQLQGFDASYIGNPKLCGAPLNNCTTKEEIPETATSPKNEDGGSIRESLYQGMGVGFAAGFWGICGSLFLIRKWRHAFYRFVDGVGDKLYVTLMVIMQIAELLGRQH
ncbi:hypothetical protein TSUD_131540 [Trifolium subterraneum]|uniref:Leucine-rich repeat-containing N-terminal plant-type domain-containing protein n=1 Tax=Trifolium subterraneum TaxID=3900 RepID=A0A2Z6P843_TRISU|nr:hypothetical protein TSUD_131540 [Trifolium subterraneum]